MKPLFKLHPVTLFALLVFAGSAFSQQAWERNYGLPNPASADGGSAVRQTSDGGYIVVGNTDSIGARVQIYLVRTDSFGDTLWTRTHGQEPFSDNGASIQATLDGGYIIAGYTQSFGSMVQVYLIKINALGDTLWTRTYGGESYDYGYCVWPTSDGGYFITGTTYSFGNYTEVYLIKTDADGDTLWTRVYGRGVGIGGGPGEDLGASGQQTHDGGYIVAGTTQLYDARLVYLIKTDAAGDTLWTNAYPLTTYQSRATSVQQTADSGYIVTGYNSYWEEFPQAFLMKTDVAGTLQWQKRYGGAGDDRGSSVRQTSDGGYIIAGTTTSFGNYYQFYLIKTNSSGDTLWTRVYGGAESEYGSSVQQTVDGGYIVTGSTHSFGNSHQVYLVKTDAQGNSGVEESQEGRGQKLEVRITTKPNPFTSFATIPGHEAERFSLYDISGRKVGDYRGDRIGEGLAPGVYFIVSIDKRTNPLRIVKVR
jgi:hypothetical protein